MSADERVLCVTKVAVDAALPMGWTHDYTLSYFLGQGRYRNRKTPNDDGPCAEEDERWVQLIPYVVVRCGGLILAHERNGTEERLRRKWSIGIGGHVNDTDKDWYTGVCREIREEIGEAVTVGLYGFELSGPLGFLRDDSNPVGRVHLGVLYTLDVPDCDSVKMVECADYRWFDRIHVGGLNLENWSRMALDMMKGGA